MATVQKSNPFLFFQRKNIRSERISTEHGLSSSIVLCIYQDSMGFMWFGSYDGLNKYDGNKFTIYRNNINNPSSISGNFIWTIYEDKSGIIWIGTDDGGLNKFDRKREKFVHYMHNPDDPTSLSDSRVRSIYEDSQGNFWIGTYGGGLNKFDRDKEVFTIYKNNPEDSASINCDLINRNSIIEDKFGNFWIGTDCGGLNKFDRKREKFVHYIHNPNDSTSLSNDNIYTLYEDTSNNLLIGTQKGGLNMLVSSELESLSCNNGDVIPKFIHYKHDPDDPTSLSRNFITCICEDESGILWIGTNGGGLNTSVLSVSNSAESDKKNNTITFKNFSNDPNDPTSLSDNKIHAICKDRSGLIWVV